MKYLGSTQTYACSREYYRDSDGRLVERLLHDSDDHDPVIESNKQAAAEYRPHGKSNIRRIASIPVDIYMKWLKEENVEVFCDNETMDRLIERKLKDPANKYLLTVPETYRMMRHG